VVVVVVVVEAVLSEGDEETGAYDPLDRLKMAMNYEEKKAPNHARLYTVKKRIGESLRRSGVRQQKI